MTLQELSSHFELRECLAKTEDLLENLRASADPKSPVLTGMPRTPGASDRVGYLAVEIADIQTEIEKLKMEIARSEDKISAYIATIPDIKTRTIFRLRFIQALTWGEVAGIIGKYATEASVKSACARYLKRQQEV